MLFNLIDISPIIESPDNSVNIPLFLSIVRFSSDYKSKTPSYIKLIDFGKKFNNLDYGEYIVLTTYNGYNRYLGWFNKESFEISTTSNYSAAFYISDNQLNGNYFQNFHKASSSNGNTFIITGGYSGTHGNTLRVYPEISFNGMKVHENAEFVTKDLSFSDNSSIKGFKINLEEEDIYTGADSYIDFYYSIDGGSTWISFDYREYTLIYQQDVTSIKVKIHIYGDSPYDMAFITSYNYINITLITSPLIGVLKTSKLLMASDFNAKLRS